MVLGPANTFGSKTITSSGRARNNTDRKQLGPSSPEADTVNVLRSIRSSNASSRGRYLPMSDRARRRSRRSKDRYDDAKEKLPMAHLHLEKKLGKVGRTAR
jgi:hypothetical protein